MRRLALFLLACVAVTAAAIAATEVPSWIHKITITFGSELAADGTVPDTKDVTVFAPGDVVYLSMDVAAAPDKTPIKVVWLRPDGSKISEETKTTIHGKRYLTFASGDTKSWAKGTYKLEFWFGDRNVGSGTVEFS